VALAPRSVNVLNMITGSFGRTLRNSFKASKPVMTGISTSSVTRSGSSCAILERAMRPSLAEAITSSSGSADKVSQSNLRITTESSTTRIRMRAIESYSAFVVRARRRKLRAGPSGYAAAVFGGLSPEAASVDSELLDEATEFG